MLDEFLQEPRASRFSMEIALRTQGPAYARGRRMLAADRLRFAADLALPLGAVILH